MPTPAEIVTTFLASWERPGGLDASFRDYFLPTTVWENVGLATTTGADEAIALNAQMGQAMGIATIRVENLAVATCQGLGGVDKVLTERIDHLIDGGGKTVHSAAVMGIFEVEGGKIAAWRDYFDSAAALALQGGG